MILQFAFFVNAFEPLLGWIVPSFYIHPIAAQGKPSFYIYPYTPHLIQIILDVLQS